MAGAIVPECGAAVSGSAVGGRPENGRVRRSLRLHSGQAARNGKSQAGTPVPPESQASPCHRRRPGWPPYKHQANDAARWA